MNNSKVFFRILNNSNSSKVIYSNHILKNINNFKNIKNQHFNNNNKLYLSSLKSSSSSSSILSSNSSIKYNKSFFSTQVNENKDIKKEENKDQQSLENKDQQSLENKDQQSLDNKEQSLDNKEQQQKLTDKEQQQDSSSNSNNNEQQQQQQQQQEEKPKTLKEKILSKLKWTLIIGSIAGSIGFLFYESYLRNTLPYRMTMDILDKDVEVLRNFGGHITSLKWYKCFTNPIFGWVQNEEGGMSSWTYLRIPITRYIAPPLPKPKEGEPEIIPISLPEDSLFKGHDRGANVGIVYVRMVKRTANFFDWVVDDLQVHCDNNQIIKVVDSEKNKIKIDTKRF